MEIALHLGAHKTATTYLQTRLKRHARALATFGVGVPALADLRAGLTPGVAAAAQGSVAGLLARLRVRRMAGDIVADAEARGARRLLLSEENFIGNCARIVARGEFYPGAGPALRALARGFRGVEPTLFLAVRGYAGFYASAWGQRLRSGHFRPFDAGLRARFLASPRGWPALVGEIRAAFPGARLVLWQYEDFERVEPAVLAHMIGPEAAAELPPLAARPLTGFSQRAVDEIARAAGADGTVERAVVQDCHDRFPKGPFEPAFDPWSEAERAELDLRYAMDVAGLRDRLGADFLG